VPRAVAAGPPSSCGLHGVLSGILARRVREVEFLRRLSVSQNAVQLGVRHTVGPDQGPQGTLGASVRP